MKKKKHIIQKVILGSAVTAGVFGVAFNQIVLTKYSKKINEFSLKKKDGNSAEKEPQEKDLLRAKTLEWYSNREKEHTVINNFEGKRIHSFIVKSKENSHNWAVLTHGYTSAPGGMSEQAMYYGEKGYNLLLPALRGHGVSEEKYISMGWYDRLDMLDWINYIISLDSEAQIVLHGVSMGAGTAMLTTGEDLPVNVKCCISDCGYTTLWEEYESEFKTHYHIPTFPLLNSASLATKVICGFDFKEVSCIEQLKKSKTPTLFIHGENDTFVPYRMMNKNYNACAAEKDYLSVPDAGHGESSRVHPELYWQKVTEFTDKFVK